MKRIKLTQGKFALVDDSDFNWLNQWKWYALKKKYNCWSVVRLPLPPSSWAEGGLPAIFQRSIAKSGKSVLLSKGLRVGLILRNRASEKMKHLFKENTL